MTAAEKLKDAYMTETEVAAILRIKVSTLRKNRGIGVNHPPCVVLSRKMVYYPAKEFEKWISSQPLQREVSR